MQSKKDSLFETLFSLAIGYVIAVCSQMLIFPLFGLVTSMADNMLMAAYFTVVSLIRGYFVRRYFNSRHRQANQYEELNVRDNKERTDGRGSVLGRTA